MRADRLGVQTLHATAAPISRRQFVSQAARGSAALAGGASVLSAVRSLRAQGANERVVLALVGAGGRGSGLASNFAQIPGVEFKYVCDADQNRGAGLLADLEKKQGRAPQRLQDLRVALDDKDVHGVVVATPEQWHALATVWACQAGKDVYVEKNTSLTLWEGRKMLEAARKYRRVVQVGFQNRSAPYGVTAREYIQSGKLGRVVLVKVFNLLDGGPWQPQPDTAPPAGLDWDRWLGPAPEVPYNRGRHLGWNDWWDYAGGPFSGDASHQLDLTRMVLGDPPAPHSVYCAGGRLAFPDKREMPDLLTVTYDYGDFVMTCESGNFTPYMRKFPQEVRYGTQWPYWPQSSCRVEIYGTKNLMYLGRHGCGWQVLDTGGKVIAEDKGYFPDKWHQPNFIECVRSRQQPNADIEQAHQSGCLIHLGVAAFRTGKQLLHFDAATERFTNSDAANQMLRPAYRKHYRVPDEV
jgi:predicted dehydrogenase